jgi:4-oxalocrotonate tautomerase
MPLIEVKVIENVFSPDQKRGMIERFTDTLVDLEGEHMRPVTLVTVEEVASGSWGIGGQAITSAGVAALKAEAIRQAVHLRCRRHSRVRPAGPRP